MTEHSDLLTECPGCARMVSIRDDKQVHYTRSVALSEHPGKFPGPCRYSNYDVAVAWKAEIRTRIGDLDDMFRRYSRD